MSLLAIGNCLCGLMAAAAALPDSLVNSPAARREALALARQALAQQVVGAPATLQPRSALARFQAGAFVVVVLQGRTRACAGSVQPTRRNAAEEIVAAAAAAAGGDPWHPPLRKRDLDSGRVEVCLAGPSSPIRSLQELDVRRQGLLLRCGDRSAVILPGEAKTAAWALREAKRKAGVRPGEHPQLLSFPAVRWTETPIARQERHRRR